MCIKVSLFTHLYRKKTLRARKKHARCLSPPYKRTIVHGMADNSRGKTLRAKILAHAKKSGCTIVCADDDEQTGDSSLDIQPHQLLESVIIQGHFAYKRFCKNVSGKKWAYTADDSAHRLRQAALTPLV